MEQTNMVMAMYQAMAAQTALPKTGKTGDKELSDFQKLLDQKTQAQTQPAKDDAPVEEKSQANTVKKTEKAPAEEEEDPIARVKRLMEQGAWITQPPIGSVDLETGEVFEAGQYVIAHLDESTEVIPVAELSPWQQQQLQQLVHNVELMENATDPKADAMLEATDPSVEHKLTDLLEEAVDTEAGQVMEEAVAEVQPEAQEDDEQVEITDAEQAPQQIFHDVKAAPVKVGDVYDAQKTEEPDVAGQIDTQMAQALQRGDSVVRIQLTPENLGEVTVEISRSAEGVLRVALTAHNADTRGLLERHAGELQGMLSTRTSQSVEVNVQHQQENQQHQQNYDGRNGHAQHQQERRQRQQHASPEDFMQQLRLGLIPADGEL